MKKIPTPYLQDILDSIKTIKTHIRDGQMTQSQFNKDIKTQDAVIRRLEIIGEATKRLKTDFRKKYDQIPWRQMAGLRDVLIHDYDEVDLEQIWEVITNDINILEKQVKTIISQVPNFTCDPLKR